MTIDNRDNANFYTNSEIRRHMLYSVNYCTFNTHTNRHHMLQACRKLTLYRDEYSHVLYANRKPTKQPKFTAKW